MLTPMDIFGGNLLAYTASGKVTDADYKQTLIPAIQAAVEQHGKVRLLMHLGPKFDGYTAQAIFDDAMFSMKNLKTFTRIAVVTDHQLFLQGIKFFSHLHMLPHGLEQRGFGEAEMDEAKKWING